MVGFTSRETPIMAFFQLRMYYQKVGLARKLLVRPPPNVKNGIPTEENFTERFEYGVCVFLTP